MREVMQIGLHAWAEWVYLTEDNWVEIHPLCQRQKQVPPHFLDNPEPFRYYGVDCAPESVDLLSKQFKDNPRAKWLCAGLSDRNASNIHYKAFLGERKDWHVMDINQNVIYIFIPINTLFDSLAMTELDSRAVDVDGFEHALVDTLEQWHVKPQFISIELHEWQPLEGASYSALILVDKILRCGYDVYYRGIKEGEEVEEIQFLRR